jgi:hypothetical protein
VNLNEIPIACNLEAIPESEREQHLALARELFSAPLHIIRLETAYEFVFPVERLLPVAEYISRERLCCPFWDFTLILPPASQELRLRLGNREDIQGILDETLAELAAGGADLLLAEKR